jgi:hypothetical protein
VARSQLRAALAAVVIGSGSACAGGEPDAGAWEFKVDTAGQTAWLRVVGEEKGNGDQRGRAAILSFDCIPEGARTTIITDQVLRQGSTESRVSLDGGEPHTYPGFAGTTPTGGQVVLTVRQDSLLASLARHQRAVIAYEDGAGSSKTTAEFPLAGLETYRQRFLAACAGRGG